MRKTASTYWWILTAVCCCLLLSAVPSSAAESEASNATPKIDNVGFMKNPPQELVDRFPMCDAFLNVEWIDKEKKIGISKYDLYGPSNDAINGIDAIIYEGPLFPIYDYSIQHYYPNSSIDESLKKFTNNEIQKLPDFIEKGKIEIANINLRIANGNTAIEFERINLENYTLCKAKCNVCIPYPGNKIMWLAEIRQVQSIFNDKDVNNLRAKLSKAHLDANKISILHNINEFEVLDLNHDDKPDYFACNSILYSVGDEYYEMISGTTNESYGHIKFPPYGRYCEIEGFSGCYITTDGENYYYNGQCNLTELTSGGN